MRISDWSSDVCSSDLEALGQLHAAGGDDGAIDQDVHEVGLEVLEEALVVRDGDDAEVGPVAAHLLHAGRHDLQGVDVEAGVGLVEDRDLGLEDGHLARSEEHTSELQSLMRISYAVFCLKKKKHNT